MSDKYSDKYVAKLDPGYRMSMIGNRKQDSLPIVFNLGLKYLGTSS